ncbi:MAG: carboxypeptidase regulatory-like domain-containing protein [Pirellulaceae bacterium]|nr:carboxypeptidase regulatory-like domain-containing protein [Pirellulaceae bacterium]
MKPIGRLAVASAVLCLLAAVTPVGQDACGQFEQGSELTAADTVRTVEATLSVGDGADLDEPLALDLGLGFPFWLHPVGHVDQLPSFGAVPQESNAALTVSAGQSATFTFRAEGDDGQDRLRTCSQLLSDVQVSDISRIALQGTAARPWRLAGYSICVNGKLLAANDKIDVCPAESLPQGTGQEPAGAIAEAADAPPVPVLQARLLELVQLATDIRAIGEAGFGTEADRQALVQIEQQIVELKQQLAAAVPPGAPRILYEEAQFQPWGRNGEAIESLSVTVSTRPVASAATHNDVYFGVGGHKFLLFSKADPPVIGMGPRRFELDLRRVPLDPSDFRGFALGMLAHPEPQSDGADEWLVDRVEVRRGETVVYDSDGYEMDKLSLAAIRLTPPAWLDEQGKRCGIEERSPREVPVWRPGGAQGLDPKTLKPLPDQVEPSQPDTPALIVAAGYVMYKDATSSTGYRGIRGVEVILNAPSAVYSAVTNQRGAFELKVPAGEYLVDLDLEASWEPVLDAPWAVTEGMQPKFFVVQRVEAAAVQVTGRVVAANAGGGLQGVAGAQVDWLRATDNGAYVVVKQSTTDAQGRFRVEIPGGDYAVETQAQGYRPSPTYLVQVRPGMSELEIELRPDIAPQPDPNPNPNPWPNPNPNPWPNPNPNPNPWPNPWPLPNQVSLQVQVLKIVQGNAVACPGAQVQCGQFNQATDPQGLAFFAQGLQVNSNYNIQATLAGFQPGFAQTQTLPGMNFASITLQPQAPPAETLPLDIFVQRGDVEPPVALAGARVFAYKIRQGVRGRFESVTDGQGKAHFDLSDGPGKYVAVASAATYAPGETEVNVRPGQPNQGTIVLRPPGSDDPSTMLEVTVLGPEGKALVPLERAWVFVVPDESPDANRLEAQTDANGVARLALPKAGKYAVTASADGHEPGETRIQAQGGVLNECSLTLAKKFAEIRLTAQVFRTEGKGRWPLPGARVQAFKDDRSGAQRATALTGPDGTAELTLRDGEATYLAVALKPGFQPDARNVDVVVDSENCIRLYLAALPDDAGPVVPWPTDDSPVPVPVPPVPVPVPPVPVPVPPVPVPPTPDPVPLVEQPAVSLPVVVYEEMGGRRQPVAEVRVLLKPLKGDVREIRSGQTDAQGRVELQSTAGEYVLVASKAGYKTVGKEIAIQAGAARISEILIMREGPEPTQPTVTGCSFDGLWDVCWYNNVEGTGEPTEKVRMKVVVERGKATGYMRNFDGQWEDYCSGPLSDDGQVWSAQNPSSGQVTIQYDDVRFVTDCDHFRGKWSSAPPKKDFAWVGVRVVDPTDATPKPPVEPMPDPVVGKTKPPAIVSGSLPLAGMSHDLGLRVAPGASIDFWVNLSNANPFEARLARADRSVTVSERSEAAPRKTGPGGRPLIGAPTERRVFTARVAPDARGTQTLVFELKRPWEAQASNVYTVRLQVVEDGTRTSLEELIELWGLELVQLYSNAQSMRREFHFHPIHQDGYKLCNADRIHRECYSRMLSIYRQLNQKEKWGLSEEQLKKAAWAWLSGCVNLPDDKPDECGCYHDVPSNTHTGW